MKGRGTAAISIRTLLTGGNFMCIPIILEFTLNLVVSINVYYVFLLDCARSTRFKIFFLKQYIKVCRVLMAMLKFYSLLLVRSW